MGKKVRTPTFFIMNDYMLENIKKHISPLLEKNNVELVELILTRMKGKAHLRFLVDKDGGVTLDECARINQEIGRMLDDTDALQESYILEVSSPGLDRPLKSTRDFQRSLGQQVRIVLHTPIDKQNVFMGLLEEVDEENIFLRTQKESKFKILRANIARANLEAWFN